jgi:hypothetical protein
MPSSSLDADVRKVINRWTREGFYVYLRPITSKYIDARNKHKTYWKVSVELRDVPPGHWEAEGYNLDECVRELATKVPRDRAQWKEDRPAGWMAPESVLQKEIDRAKASIKQAKAKAKKKKSVKSGAKSERPRKRPKK